MALKVFKADEASRDYENDFFRKFSGNLVEVFKKEKLDGILIGHPTVPANKYLKPDCVLITSNRLVIIDFKNHGGKIWLPDSSSFENAPWRHDDTIVDGGSSINPFEQLKKQRQWIEELIGENGLSSVIYCESERKGRDRADKPEYKVKLACAFAFSNRIKLFLSTQHNNPSKIKASSTITIAPNIDI